MVQLGPRVTLEELVEVHQVLVWKLIQAFFFGDLGVSEEFDQGAFVLVLPLVPKTIVLAFEWHCKARYEIWLLEDLVALFLKFVPALDERPYVVHKDLHEVLLIEEAIFVVKLGGQRPYPERGPHVFLLVRIDNCELHFAPVLLRQHLQRVCDVSAGPELLVWALEGDKGDEPGLGGWLALCVVKF